MATPTLQALLHFFDERSAKAEESCGPGCCCCSSAISEARWQGRAQAWHEAANQLRAALAAPASPPIAGTAAEVREAYESSFSLPADAGQRLVEEAKALHAKYAPLAAHDSPAGAGMEPERCSTVTVNVPPAQPSATAGGAAPFGVCDLDWIAGHEGAHRQIVTVCVQWRPGNRLVEAERLLREARTTLGDVLGLCINGLRAQGYDWPWINEHASIVRARAFLDPAAERP